MSSPPRTNPTAVQGILGANYGPMPDQTLPDLNQYIAIATNMVDQVILFAATMRMTVMSITPATAELIERWLAAHYYTKMDPLYASKSQGGASGSFVASQMEPERYLEGAMNVDWTGTLRAIVKRQVAGFTSLYRPPSQQTLEIDNN